MVLNMVRRGVLGELLHCEAGYQHYVRGSQFGPTWDLTWRGFMRRTTMAISIRRTRSGQLPSG
jgi:hypothetical protein